MHIKENIISLCLNKDISGLTYSQIGKKYGISGEAVRSMFRRWKKSNIKNDIMPENNIFNKIKIERQKLQQERNEIRKYVRKVAKFELIIEEIQKGIDRLPSLPYYKLCSVCNNNRELVMLLSDIHLGEEIDLFEINKYNSEIIKERLIKYFSEVVHIAKEHKVDKINLCLLGDLITNFNIFKSQINYIDLDPISQIIELSEILCQLINQLSVHFPVEIYCVYGNHGITDRLLGNKVNYERLIYEFIKIRFKNNDNIITNDTNGIWSIMKIFNYNYLLLHGDNMDDKNSPYRMKEIINSIGIDITEILLAHSHHNVEKELFSNGFGILCNASLTAANDYSFRKLQVASKASQTVFIVEQGRGRWCTYRIRLN